jgi:hypothetical protein
MEELKRKTICLVRKYKDTKYTKFTIVDVNTRKQYWGSAWDATYDGWSVYEYNDYLRNIWGANSKEERIKQWREDRLKDISMK